MINPWSFRHTGIYHHHSSQLDLFIILHPNEESILDTRLCEWLGVTSDTSSLEGISSLQREPNSLHLFVLSSFLDNWRWYLRHLGERFSEMVGKTLEWQRRLSCRRLIWAEWRSIDNTTRGSWTERKLYPSESLAKSQRLGASSSGMLQEQYRHSEEAKGKCINPVSKWNRWAAILSDGLGRIYPKLWGINA